ncbi:MAG: hypothetical protein HUJ71_07800 [Pseudobutyrivibrio sp.]|nr:hypothetical protein [Pseudobutyrivibrio sp.]
MHDKLTSESVLQFLVNKEPRECFLSDIMEVDTDTLQLVLMNNGVNVLKKLKGVEVEHAYIQ